MTKGRSARTGAGALAVVVAAGVAGLGAGEAVATSAAPAPARLQVSADEFRYGLSRLRLRAGPVIVELVNYGEDDHNLRLRRVGGPHVHRIARTAPGEVSRLRTRFRAGDFKLWCSLPGHKAAGMKAALRVVKR